MGYQAGTSLGTSSSGGIKEPIKINIKTEGRLGLGTETVIRETRERQINNLKRKIDACDMSTEDYRKQMRDVSDKKQVVWDLHKLQRTCRLIEIDSRIKSPIHAWFWPDERPKDKLKNDSDDDDDDDEEEEKNKCELSDAEKLEMLRKFLRNSYFYCEYCSVHYKDANDMTSNCPGPLKDDH
jgi:hypothetical protein